MTRILRRDSPSRPSAPDGTSIGGAVSRAMADRITARRVSESREAVVQKRDLIAESIGHVADETVRGYGTPPEAMTDLLRAATAQSDTLIAEVGTADKIVLSAPIYNFSAPTALKAWIDQIVRVGHTFAHEDGPVSGLLADRPTYLALSCGAGGYAPGGPPAAHDVLRPSLTGLLKLVGLTSVDVFTVEATTGPDAAHHLAAALAEIDARAPAAQAA